MIVRRKTIWRQLAKRFVVLGLATLAPTVASARVPYRSKPLPAERPAMQATATTAGDREPESASSVAPSSGPSTQRDADAPALPAGSDDHQATAGGACLAAGACGMPTLGTTVHWMPTPDDAGKLAEKEHKLLFLIQVSGNFAREGFT
ncbi:MAG TPA: hypothetical protein VND64_06485 [Pirellulales bacterium]|nr:hypothetical protein [Pirellulales bacterium]